MSTLYRSKRRQRSSSSDEDGVFLPSVATVQGSVQAAGVVRTHRVIHARGAVPPRLISRSRRGRPIQGTWVLPRGGGRGVGGAGGGRVGGRAGAGCSSRRGGVVSVGPSGPDDSVIALGSSTKRGRSPSSEDEDRVFLH